MKICVYFNQNSKSESFEGVRLVKNIKGALSLNNIAYAKHIIDSYDLIHFISLDDELKINDAKEAGIPVVFSALSCESDDQAKILTEKKDGYSLSNKALRVLNKVDVVLVSDEASKKVLIDNGVKTDIKVVSAGVNLSRFEFVGPLEDEIFYKYYRLEKDQKYIVSIGTYDDREKRKLLYEIAERCPKYKFFYFGIESLVKLTRLGHKIPSNLKLYPLTNSEIYCSMMKKASCYLAFDNDKHAPITLLDVAASKTPIVALSPTGLNEELLNNLHAFKGNNADEVSDIINKVLSNEIQPPIDEAYEYAKKNSLIKLGEQLIHVYEEVLDRRAK